MAEDHENLLALVYSHEANGLSRHAVGSIVNGIDDMLLESDFAGVDAVLQVANPSILSTESLVAMLAMTFRNEKRLPNYRMFFAGAVAVAHARGEAPELISRYATETPGAV